jgi:hypothetical protein
MVKPRQSAPGRKWPESTNAAIDRAFEREVDDLLGASHARGRAAMVDASVEDRVTLSTVEPD